MDQEKDDSTKSRLLWLVVPVLLILAGYQVYSGVFLRKIGVPGLFELEFRESEDPNDECARPYQLLEIARAHFGGVTPVWKDVDAFHNLVLESGCLGRPYTLELRGKQGVNQFVITVANEYLQVDENGIEYHYRDYMESLHTNGGVENRIATAKKRPETGDLWVDVEPDS